MNIQNFAQKALVLKGDSILLIHYGENKYSNEHSITGTWGLPGGRIEMGEKPDEAIVRKVKEETGITCTPGKPFYVWNWEYQKEDDVVQINAIMRECEYVSGEVLSEHIDGESTIDKIEWIKLSDIKNLPITHDQKEGIELGLNQNPT